ncbi:MAG TPA: PEP-CTERM sorting domain-containing protein [Bryobacteraceae bacterium]|nr:PEP-CTERM sorting domain-containing protein [Bryobacteraceae bacterium]
MNDGILSFQTGSFDASHSSTGVYVFDPTVGTTFLITGGVADAGITQPPGGPLVGLTSGGSLGAVFDASQGDVAFPFNVGISYVNPQLEEYFGLTPGAGYLFSSLVFSTPVTSSGTDPNPAFTANVVSNYPSFQTSIIATSLAPEPGPVFLLGSSLLVVIGFRRQRR